MTLQTTASQRNLTKDLAGFLDDPAIKQKPSCLIALCVKNAKSKALLREDRKLRGDEEGNGVHLQTIALGG
ncbi:hypothetical protein [Cellvibrio japonicus]|uniref:hypothetical protein n=1 Tax=Cellvibrio japonicus TaxID=155077 RepID=UPI0011D0A8FB|nr:hypothetical protein [Cellvibrio japonicus]QEI13619.1 hypothetical protein FY117_16305 [Cellvibrio japonicus]QEI17193.1 hypothetical protein FY116_16310 [Cellvibrio japonicus]QEI20770.1 hypothetical protein FY115_16305 [Cellvibrio japonicus]